MKKRIVPALLSIMLMLSVAIPCYAAETRASKYFDGYILGMSAPGNSQMTVAFSVLGMSKMDKIGAYYIRIEEEVYTGKWITTFTAYGDSDPSKFYSYDAHDHTGSYTFTGIPNVKYRAVLKAYASNSNGYEYSDEIVCTGKVCK